MSRHGIGSRRECKTRPRDTTGDKRGDSRMAGLYQARKYNRDVSLEQKSFVSPKGGGEEKSISDGVAVAA